MNAAAPSSSALVSSEQPLSTGLTARFVGLLRRELDTAAASADPRLSVVEFLVNRTASRTTDREPGNLARGLRKASEALLPPPPEKLLAPLAQAAMAADTNPLVCFINSKSGGKTGAALLTKLGPVLNAAQLCDLSRDKPATYLNLYSACPRLRVLVCGGDGE